MIERLDGRAQSIDRKLALHFISFGAKQIPSDDGFATLLDECEKLVLDAQSLSAVYGIYDIALGQPLDLGFATVNSRDLERSLEGCDKIILFAATAGIGIDRLILKYGRLSPSKAAVIQAAGAALVERWCDEICLGFTKRYGANAFRYSCGFGDLPLTLQRDIFTALDLERTLGMRLSDNCLMTPSKSVTAIVGIKNGYHNG